MSVEPKIGVVFTPQIIHFYRLFHYFHHPFWGTTIFGNNHITNPNKQHFCQRKSLKFIVDFSIKFESPPKMGPIF